MSTTRGGDPVPDGQEDPAGMAGVQAGPSRALEGVDHNSGPHRGDAVAGAGGITEASGGPREVALEGGSAEEGEEEQAGSLDLTVEAHHLPMAGFRLTFLDLVHSVLNRFCFNDYILIWPHNGHASAQHRARQHSSNQGSAAVAEFSEPRESSDGPGEGPAGKAPAQEAEEAEEASLWETATEESEESSLWEMAQEPAAPEEIAKHQDDNSKKRSKTLKVRGKKRSITKNKKNQKRIWTQQRTGPENPVWKTRKMGKEES